MKSLATLSRVLLWECGGTGLIEFKIPMSSELESFLVFQFFALFHPFHPTLHPLQVWDNCMEMQSSKLQVSIKICEHFLLTIFG